MKTKKRTDRRGRVLRTAAQRHELVCEWQSSGMSQAEYCAKHGVNPTTFNTWCRTARAKPVGRPKPKAEFAEFRMVNSAAPIEVELPGRIVIRLRDAAICHELFPMLKGESSC